jgi:hypothetical protein
MAPKRSQSIQQRLNFGSASASSAGESSGAAGNDGDGGAGTTPSSDATVKAESQPSRSPLWKHFFLTVSGLAQCEHCWVGLSEERKALPETERLGETKGLGLLKRNTTNMKGHAERKHNLSIVEDETQTTLDDYTEVAEPAYSKERLMDKVIRFVVNDDQPLSVVEDDDFVGLLRFLRPQAAKDLIKADALANRIAKKAPEVKKEIRMILQNAPHRISLTTDLWTSVASAPFMGLTAHWIDNSNTEKPPVMEDLSIALTELPDRHTGERIAAKLYAILNEYGVATKALGITADNASNVDSAMDSFWLKLPANTRRPVAEKMPQRIRCFAHILHLAVMAGLKALRLGPEKEDGNNEEEEGSDDDSDEDESDGNGAGGEDTRAFWTALLALRRIIRLIRKSPVVKEAYHRFCQAHGLDFLGVILDVKTRWNTVLKMLVRAIKQRPAIDAVAQANKKDKLRALTDEEWTMFGHAVRMLESFEQATLVVSSASTPTLSLTLHIFNILMDELEDLQDQEEVPAFVKVGAKAALEKLAEYYQKTDFEADAYMMALLLDPRCNMRSIRKWDESLKDQYMALFIRVVKGYAAAGPDLPVAQPPLEDPRTSFAARLAGDLDSDEIEGEDTTVDAECKRYLGERRAKIDENSLLWWFQKSRDYPTVYRAAMDYLAVQGVSVPSERMFSAAGRIHTKERASMKTETLENLYMLKSYNAYMKRRASRK